MSSLAQRRKEQAEEKERVKNRLATMEPLLQHTYVRLDESPADRAIAQAAAQQSAGAIVPVGDVPPPPAGEAGGLQELTVIKLKNTMTEEQSTATLKK